MAMIPQHTVFSDDAQRVATSDRTATATWVLQAAIDKARRLIRLGSVEGAEQVLHRAGISAERITGRAKVEQGTVWTSRLGHTTHVCTAGCAPTAATCCWAGMRAPHTPVDGVCQWCGWVDAQAVTA